MANAIFSAMLGVGLAAMCANSAAAQREGDYCKYGKEASLFLIDRTTAADDTDQGVLIESLGTVIDKLAVGERLSLGTITDHYSTTQRLVSECSPGCPASGLISSCSSVRAKADQRAFKGKLALAIQPLTSTSSSADKSDLTGTIAQWTQGSPADRPISRVYIFSDMLENSQVLPWSKVKTMSAPAMLEVVKKYNLLPKVADAEVRIVGFGRSHDPGRPPLNADLDHKLREFWLAYFKAGGARSVSFEGALTN